MSWVILCVLLCLGSLIVMGQAPSASRRQQSQRNPPPKPSSIPPRKIQSQPVRPRKRQSVSQRNPGSVPWPGQQCKDSGFGHAGVCSVNPGMCQNLLCAYPDGRGGFVPDKYKAALPYTVCGVLQVCRERSCVNLDINFMPIQTGERAVVECNWQ